MEDIVANDIYDYAIFATSGSYQGAIWTSSHGQSHDTWFRTTMLIAYVVIFSMFWCDATLVMFCEQFPQFGNNNLKTRIYNQHKPLLNLKLS
jgi:hypothetical protein